MDSKALMGLACAAAILLVGYMPGLFTPAKQAAPHFVEVGPGCAFIREV